MVFDLTVIIIFMTAIFVSSTDASIKETTKKKKLQ